MLRLTLDTNLLDDQALTRVRSCLMNTEHELAVVTVTERERGDGSEIGVRLPETAVWGESRWGEAV